MLDQPLRLALVIMDLRAYAAAKRAMDDAAESGDGRTPDWAADIVFPVIAELQRRAREAPDEE